MRIVGGRFRGRTLLGAEVAGDPADRRPAARVAVQHPRARLRRSGHGRARARPVRRHRRARARGAVARRGVRAVRRRRRRGARAACAAMSMRSALGGATKIFRRDATRLGPAHPLEPFSLAFLDPPYGQGLAEQALAVGARRRLARARRAGRGRGGGGRGLHARRRASRRLERRDYDDTQLIFLRCDEPCPGAASAARSDALHDLATPDRANGPGSRYARIALHRAGRSASIHADAGGLDDLAPALDVLLEELARDRPACAAPAAGFRGRAPPASAGCPAARSSSRSPCASCRRSAWACPSGRRSRSTPSPRRPAGPARRWWRGSGMIAARRGAITAMPFTVPCLRLHRAALDGGAHVVDAVGDHVLQRRAFAAIGHHGDVDAEREVEQRAGQVRAGADAGRANTASCPGSPSCRRSAPAGCSPAGPCARPGGAAIPSPSPTGSKSVDRIVGLLLVERLAVDVGAAVADQEGVAVGRGLGDAAAADGAGRGADVFDHDGLAERFRPSPAPAAARWHRCRRRARTARSA